MKARQYLLMRPIAQPMIIAGFCLLVMLWGLFPIAIKLGMQDAPPFFLSSLRLGFATCIMAPISKWTFHSTDKFTMLTRHTHLQSFPIGSLIPDLPPRAS